MSLDKLLSANIQSSHFQIVTTNCRHFAATQNRGVQFYLLLLEITNIESCIQIQLQDLILDSDWIKCYQTPILASTEFMHFDTQ